MRPMECKIFLLTERFGDIRKVVGALRKQLFVRVQSLRSGNVEDLSEYAVLIVDINLDSDDVAAQFQKFCRAANVGKVPKVFVVDKAAQLSRIQLDDQEATQTVSRPIDHEALRDALIHCSPIVGRELRKKPNLCLAASQTSFTTLATIDRVVRAGGSLSKEHIDQDAQNICDAVASGSVMDWLIAVNNHHSYTFRHTLHVAGLMLAFADHLGFSDRDKARVARGALMHDVGKAKIPSAVLEKEGSWTFKEQALVYQHPTIGLDVLTQDGGWDPLTLTMVHQHHEYLDGSGYPKRLTGTAISDPVRMLTIADIFADCVDQRAGKKPMAPKAAMKVLYSKPQKVDMDFVRAFEPVALRVMGELGSLKAAA